MAVAAEPAQGIGFGERGAGALVEIGAPAQVLDVAERHPGTGRDHAFRRLARQRADFPEAKADRRLRGLGPAPGIDRFKARLDRAVAHVHRMHRDAVPPRVLHDLRRRVEAQRLRVQQRAGESRRLVALEPAACVGEQGEAGGVRLREAVAAEALHLLEDLFGEIRRIAPLGHAGEQALAMVLEAAAALPRRHRAAQFIGLAGRVPRRHHRDLHHLLLEQRHAERAAEHRLQRLRGVAHRVDALPAAQIGCTMPPWIGPGRTMATSMTRS